VGDEAAGAGDNPAGNIEAARNSPTTDPGGYWTAELSGLDQATERLNRNLASMRKFKMVRPSFLVSELYFFVSEFRPSDFRLRIPIFCLRVVLFCVRDSWSPSSDSWSPNSEESRVVAEGGAWPEDDSGTEILTGEKGVLGMR
jgi:hypothetical protein